MGKKKRVLSLLLAAIFMLSFLPPVTVANAEGVDGHSPQPMPVGRLKLEMSDESDGLTCSVDRDDGKIDIHVTAADWEDLFFSQMGYNVRMTATPPEDMGITRYQSIMGWFDVDDLNASFDDEDILDYPNYGVIGVESFAMVKETLSGTLVVPRTITDIHMAIRWFTASDAEPVLTEIFTLNISHTDTSAHYITVSVPSETRVKMNTTDVDEIESVYIEGTGVNYFATDLGALVGQIQDGGHGGNRFLYIMTTVEAPENAATYKIWHKSDPSSPVTGNAIEIPLNIVYDDAIQKGHIISTPNIYWYDTEGKFILQETLRIDYYYADGNTPWPEVGGRWAKLPKERIAEFNAIDTQGINVAMDNGRIDITFAKDPMPMLDQASLKIFTVTPPVGAVSYKYNESYLPMMDGETTADQDRRLNNSDWSMLEEDAVSCYVLLAEATAVSDSPMTVYFSTNDDAGYAHTFVFDWKLENGYTVSEYFFVTVGKFGYVKETAAIGNEEALTEPVEDPTIISKNDWMLRTEYVPQSGENAVFYELSLKDDKGKFLNSIDGTTVVLPFPEGMDYEEALNHTFVIRHYSADLTTYTEIEAIVKEYGLAFTATGFSPYVLSWEGDESESYTVTFKSNGGSEVAEQTIPRGGKVEGPGDPSRPGCNFLGWCKDKALTQPWDFDIGTVSENMTLYAKWELVSPEFYVVTFESYDGSAVDEQIVEPLESIEKPYVYLWGHAIQGWYTDEDFSEESKWDFISCTVTDDITLYAKWVEADTTVAINQPNAVRVNYTEGDRLDLSGLELSVVFDAVYNPDGWLVGSAYFEEMGITTIPANGAMLTTADKKVTITVLGKSAEFDIHVKAKSSSGGVPLNPSPTTVTDHGTTGTGTSVTGAIPSGAVLTVGELSLPAMGENAAADAIRAEMGRSDALVLFAKDIKLSKGFTGKLTISLPIDAKYNGQTVTILHDNNGTLERYTAVVTNGQVMFEVTSLSPFVVLLYATAAKVPNTGADAGAFPFALLALSGMSIIAAVYRRRAKEK